MTNGFIYLRSSSILNIYLKISSVQGDKVPQKNVNFFYLEDKWPKLALLAYRAEEYAYIDSRSSLFNTRIMLELMVGDIFGHLKIKLQNKKTTLGKKINNAQFKRCIPLKIFYKINGIVMQCNNAVHDEDFKQEDSVWVIKELFHVACWFYNTFSPNDKITGVNFVDPKNEAVEKPDESIIANLQKELEDAENKQADLQDSINHLEEIINDTSLEDFNDTALDVCDELDLDDFPFQKLDLIDAFSEFNLTKGQVELVHELKNFINNNSQNVFLLNGHAGTGKTFIIKGLTEYFKSVRRNYVLAAPTGKAAKVIANKTGSEAFTLHKTIYSLNDIKEYKDKDLDGSETYKFYAELAVNEMSVDTVYIVDEASMVSDIKSEMEFFRFGSGYLLRDLFKFVNLDLNDHRKKVIFIGDNAQLPPVGMNFSPALSIKYLSKNYNAAISTYQLTNVVRQRKESGILESANLLRKGIESSTYNQIAFDFNSSELNQVEHENIIHNYLESCDNKINSDSIVIAFSNASVSEYNKLIRSYFFPDNELLCSGDKVMATENNSQYGVFISNGDFGLVRKVADFPEQRTISLKERNKETDEVKTTVVSLSFREIEVGFRGTDGRAYFFTCQIIENLLYSDQASLSSDERKAIYIDFCTRHSQLKPNSKQFKDALQSDPYFNALKLKFGYAITCHKSQGSEWKNVFVNCKTHIQVLSEGYYRWLYTAITRSSNNLYLLDAPNIKPGSGIKVVSTPGSIVKPDNTEEPVSNSTNSTSLDVDESEDDFGIAENNYFSLEVLKRVKSYIQNSSIKIQNIEQGQYQELYFFEKGSELVRIDIGYNGKGKINRTSASHKTELSEEIVKLISPINGAIIIATKSSSASSYEFEEEFLNEFHRRLVSLAKQKNIDVNNVEPMGYNQRYTFVQTGESVVFDIFYNGKKQFTKCSPVKNLCTSNILAAIVQDLLIEGLN
jgi:hypothetical protein